MVVEIVIVSLVCSGWSFLLVCFVWSNLDLLVCSGWSFLLGMTREFPHRPWLLAQWGVGSDSLALCPLKERSVLDLLCCCEWSEFDLLCMTREFPHRPSL